MSNNAITTTDDSPESQPVVSGPSEGEVKEIDAVDEDHPLVEETGDAALETQTESGAGEFLSDFIYEHDSAWVREWLQNHETACVRAAKLLIRMSDEYPDDWLHLSMVVSSETGETLIDYDDPQVSLAEYDGDITDVREITVPRPIDQVLEAARSLGYDPTIVFDVFRDERKIITEDNGIGMTPYEFDVAFNTIFNSGSGVDGETGGMFGVGSESSALVHGKDGGAEVETRSRRPKDDNTEYDGFRAYSYLGGANALPGEVEEGFKGTRFIIPVQGDFDISKLQEWIEKYSEKLRVPLLYREHNAGDTPVEEEYEATTFTEDYDDPPITIEKPGEYSVVAGPDVLPRTSYGEPDPEDTFLVSMPIDRNTRASISTFWDVVIQIHDEQGRIVAGPHRGQYREDVDLHNDDVPLPQPTGDRDRLQKDEESKQFFYHIQNKVESEELSQVADIAQKMKDADHPAEVIKENDSEWKLFKKMIEYHGSYNVTDQRSTFKSFIKGRDEFPDYEKKTLHQMFGLFKTVEHCHRGPSVSTKKSRRQEKPVGRILSNSDPDKVFMAASTGGNFSDYFRVVQNTYDDAEIIVVSSSSKYNEWSKYFGFNILNKVPLLKSGHNDEKHVYDVPDKVHQRKVNTGSSKSKAETVKDRALKIRTDDDNSSIDLRMSIKKAQERLENGGLFGGHRKLVLFPRTADENISDNYDFSKYAAIASVSKTEYDELAGYDDVMTISEYKEWSKSVLIPTEDGPMTPSDLIGDDRMVVLAYQAKHNKKISKLLRDENEQLRTYYANDIRDQFDWAAHLDGYDGGYRGDDVGEVPDDEKQDTLFAVAGKILLSRAEWAFDNLQEKVGYDEFEMVGVKFSHEKYGYHNPTIWKTLSKGENHYRLMADTPNWDDSSDIYNMMPSNRNSLKAQMLLGFHDRDIDPSEKTPEELRNLIN